MKKETKNIDIKQSRFRDATWFEHIEKYDKPIILGGAGGIGTWLAFFLSRMLTNSTRLVIYDFDTVEEVNMAGQFYGKQHIGKPKVEAIHDVIHQYSGFDNVIPANTRFTLEEGGTPIMFSAFDNMEARKAMFEAWKQVESKEAFIDGRLLAEQFQVFYVTPDRIEDYEKHLFDDSEVEAENCSYKQTTHFAAAIATKMIQCFTTHFVEYVNAPFYYEEVGVIFETNIKD